MNVCSVIHSDIQVPPEDWYTMQRHHPHALDRFQENLRRREAASARLATLQGFQTPPFGPTAHYAPLAQDGVDGDLLGEADGLSASLPCLETL